MTSAVQTLLQSRIIGRSSPKGWISCNCVMCVMYGQSRPDSGYRGAVIYGADGSATYKCFNCGFKTSWTPGRPLSFRMRKLLRQLGFDEAEIQRLYLELLSQADIDSLVIKESEPIWVPDWQEFEFNFDVSPLTDPAKIEYLKSRQIDDLAIWLETDSFSLSMNHRVILPYTYQNKIMGYIARYVGDRPNNIPKYIRNAPTDYVYGLDHQNDKRQYVIVSEGEFDALITKGVSIGSNQLSDRQAQLIEDLNIEPIVIPDRDKAGLTLVNKAADLGWNVSFPEWEDCKDVGDAVLKYGRLFTVYSIIESAEYSPTKIRLMGKRYCK